MMQNNNVSQNSVNTNISNSMGGLEIDTEQAETRGGNRVRSMEDLYQRVFDGYGSNENFEEVNQYISTGFCDSKEIGFIRLLNSLIRNLEFLEDIGDDVDLSSLKTQMRQRMAFITHSSKSYDGFAVKSIQTQRQISSQSLIQQDQKEEEGILDKLKGLSSKVPKTNKRFLPKQRNLDW